MPTGSSFLRLLRSFGYAARGIASMLHSEPNARIHALATAVVVAVGLAFELERGEWLAIVLAIGGVWCAEGFNTAIEAICNVVSPDHDPRVGRAKDVAAGSVLLAALCATTVAAIVFGPRLLALIGA